MKFFRFSIKNQEEGKAVNERKEEYDLSRFHEAHERDYVNALKEVRSGHKRTHWMWYIFPQVRGLGKSGTSQFYGITSIEEAKAYLKDSVLGEHMKDLCESLLAVETNNATEIFLWPDDKKLKSSMTLFAEAEPNNELFQKVLDKFFKGEKDRATLRILKR